MNKKYIMIKNVYIIDFSEFSGEFSNAVKKFFEEDRLNAFQQIYIEDDYFDWFLLIQKELKEKGYTSNDIILVNNTW